MISEIQVKSVLNRKKQRDSWFLDEYTVNPYEGCALNCLYCYVRGSKYGENMAEKLSAKTNAPAVLEKQLQLRAKKNQYGFIVIASATDAYMPIEEKYGLTRNFLELFLKYRFPVHVITKSPLILRDLSLLKEIDAAAILPDDLKNTLQKGVIISFSLSSLDKSVTSILESAAPAPMARLEAMQKIKEAGFLTGVNCLPLLPFISDSEEKVGEMIGASKKYGADYILAGGLTLFGDGPADSKTLYYKFLERFDPKLIPAYKALYGPYPFPPKSYHQKINAIVSGLCEKYQIRNSILHA